MTPASIVNVSDRLVEMGLVPRGLGDISLKDLEPSLARALTRFGDGHLLIVSEPLIPGLSKKFLRVETIKDNERAVTYVLACNTE